MFERPGWWLRIAEATLICLLAFLFGCIPRSVKTFIPETPATVLSTDLPMSTLLPPSKSPSVAPTKLTAMASTMMPSPATVQPTRVYFVAPAGDDANHGTIDQPWKTIQKAADTLTAGSIVYIRSGIYHERIMAKNSGSPGNEISFAAYPGETVTIDGDGIILPDDLAGLFEIGNKGYIRLIGLRVINSGPFPNNAAILVKEADHIVIENSTTFNTMSSGIGVWNSQDIIVAGNVIEMGGVGGGQECITIAGTSHFEVRDNIVIDCQKEGIDAKDGSSHGSIYRNVVNRPRSVGIYVDAWDKPTHNVEVFQNMVFGSKESSGFAIASEQGGFLSHIRFENNIAYHNCTYGIEISRCCKDNHPMDSIFVVNNTFYENGVHWGGGIIVDNAQARNVIIRNNICSQNLIFQIAIAADVPKDAVLVDHNMIDGYRGYEDEVYGDDYRQGDPQFEDTARGNFRLRRSSLAVDAGSAIGAPNVDFEGTARPLDGNGDGHALFDIGADELSLW